MGVANESIAPPPRKFQLSSSRSPFKEVLQKLLHIPGCATKSNNLGGLRARETLLTSLIIFIYLLLWSQFWWPKHEQNVLDLVSSQATWVGKKLFCSTTYKFSTSITFTSINKSETIHWVILLFAEHTYIILAQWWRMTKVLSFRQGVWPWQSSVAEKRNLNYLKMIINLRLDRQEDSPALNACKL